MIKIILMMSLISVSTYAQTRSNAAYKNGYSKAAYKKGYSKAVRKTASQASTPHCAVYPTYFQSVPATTQCHCSSNGYQWKRVENGGVACTNQ